MQLTAGLQSRRISIMGHLLEMLVDFLRHTILAWVGWAFLKAITLGRVDLDWREGSDSVVCEWIGLGVILGAGLIVAFALG